MRGAAAGLVAIAALALGGARAAADTATAPPGREARLAVIVGADRGDGEELALQYAEDDASRMHDLLTELGDVSSSRALLLRGASPAAVREAVREATGRAAELRDAGYRITFLFYYSGHGDEEALHLPGGSLPLPDLRAAIAAVPADVRVVILDSCRGLGRVKGVHAADAFRLDAIQRGPHGSVEIRASSDGEAAQESDELKGSVFTHFVLSGLRGDADQDGDRRVTLAELYAYAYRRTLLRTQTGPVAQHATLDVDLEGTGELVLATPGAAAATLVVPAGDDRYLIVATPSAGVIGEVTGTGGGFALPAGRYLVVARAGDRTRVAEVDLSKGGTRRLAAGDFHDVGREALVARGGWLELRRSRAWMTVGGDLAFGVPDGPAARLGGGYARVAGPWFWEIDLAGGLGLVSTDAWTGTARTLSAAALAGRRWRWSGLEVSLGAGVELREGWQALERRDPQRYRDGGFPTTAKLRYGAAGVRAVARLGLPLGDDAAIALELGGTAAIRSEVDADGSGRHFAAAWLLSPSLLYVRAF